ncbi:unnamed protein product [Cylicocyclus nassatus]|uniref:Uncharacterized protein n=1 Tax=Cylicocyclus nassatus TaxID=53992 RepID=A0AA36DKP9_CYLNA|nr:unnamed protein product [Cylicocyclus nassatus]
MGRIIELSKGRDGQEREAVVILPSRKQIRRPVNLLVPLELEDRTRTETEQESPSPQENHKRMMFESLNKEVQYLAIIMKCNTKTSSEEQLMLAKEGMIRQVEAAEALKNYYTHLKEDF